MRATIVSKAKPPWRDAIVSGFERHGIACRIVKVHKWPALLGLDLPRLREEIVVTWGWKIGRRFRDAGCNVLVIEGAYLGSREDRVSLGWNGLNNRAKFPAIDDGGKRWRQQFEHLLRPWREGGAYALIMGQVTGDAALDGVRIGRWYAAAAAMAKDRLGLPARFRPHPDEVVIRKIRGQAIGRVPGAERLDVDLRDALADAALTLTWNSTSGVGAALAGVPVIACDEGSMAWPVAGHGLNAEVIRPEREPWLHRLAWCQWSAAEISRGKAWACVREVKR